MIVRNLSNVRVLTPGTESTANDGSFEWTPSGVFDGKNNYFLSICDLSIPNECTYTYNGRFAIASSGTTSLSVSRYFSNVYISITDVAYKCFSVLQRRFPHPRPLNPRPPQHLLPRHCPRLLQPQPHPTTRTHQPPLVVSRPRPKSQSQLYSLSSEPHCSASVSSAFTDVDNVNILST